jgi:hypothetical protein
MRSGSIGRRVSCDPHDAERTTDHAALAEAAVRDD